MTDTELKLYYQNLLIIQYLGQNKAYQTVGALVSEAIMNQISTQVENAYNLDSAVGVQLDILGKYIGLSRNGYNFSGPVTLDDENYRKALKIKIIQNNYGSSLAEIQDFLNRFFANQIFVFDYLGMRIGYFIDSDFGDLTLAEFFVMGNLLPRPMAVQLSATIYGPDLNSFYGFKTYTHAGFHNTPMNDYTDYQTDYPWLDYQDALTP